MVQLIQVKIRQKSKKTESPWKFKTLRKNFVFKVSDDQIRYYLSKTEIKKLFLFKEGKYLSDVRLFLR